jgi:hypothetical protein
MIEYAFIPLNRCGVPRTVGVSVYTLHSMRAVSAAHYVNAACVELSALPITSMGPARAGGGGGYIDGLGSREN